MTNERETLTARITAISNKQSATVDKSRPNTRVVAINRSKQSEQESTYRGLSNWTISNVINQ